MSNHIFTGSGVALITPMKSDGSVNYDVLGDLVEFHVQNGTDAIIVCGTTGEAATLSEKEHCETISFVAEKTNGRAFYGICAFLAGCKANGAAV